MKKLMSLLIISAMVLYGPVNGYAQPAAMVGASTTMAKATLSQVGVVAAVNGRVELGAPGQVGRLVESGEKVFLGEVIKTDEASKIQLLLMDETIFTIGPNSSMEIEEYVYNPQNDAGKIAAKVHEGTFRFITGRIPHKKPENMEISLPTGVMGVRGTMAYVVVKDGKSTGILGGPGSEHNTTHRIGKIVMSSEDGKGKVKDTYVTKPGNASVIEPGKAPSPSFTLPKAEYEQIKQGLSGKKAAPSQKKDNAQSSSQNSAQDDDAKSEASGDETESVTELSGQEQAGGLESLKDVGQVGSASEEADDVTTGELDDIGSSIKINDGQAKFRDLLTVQGGQFNYTQTGVVLTGAGSGTYDIYLNIDFGSKTIGGPNSRVDGSATGIDSGNNFNLPLSEMSFGDLDDDATLVYTGVQNGTGSCSVCTGDVTIDFLNSGGEAATDMKHQVTVTDGSNTATGYGEAHRGAGFTP